MRWGLGERKVLRLYPLNISISIPILHLHPSTTNQARTSPTSPKHHPTIKTSHTTSHMCKRNSNARLPLSCTYTHAKPDHAIHPSHAPSERHANANTQCSMLRGIELVPTTRSRCIVYPPVSSQVKPSKRNSQKHTNNQYFASPLSPGFPVPDASLIL